MSLSNFKIYGVFLLVALQAVFMAQGASFSDSRWGKTRSCQGEKPFVIVITSYNNSEWYKRNLDSVFSQNYSNWRIIYVDDCSPDGTGNLVERHVAKSEYYDKVTLVKNKNRKLKIGNFYYAVHAFCRDDEIVIDLDGDDWFAHSHTLSILNDAYQDPDVWVTYGTYKTWPKETWCVCDVVPDWVVEQNAYRMHKWVTSQQRTFYAWLFKKIRCEDFMEGGKFLDMAGDLAYMFPILEMAGGRFKFIRDIIYTYNRANALNDDKKNLMRQLYLDGTIRGRSAYEKIEAWPLINSADNKVSG